MIKIIIYILLLIINHNIYFLNQIDTIKIITSDKKIEKKNNNRQFHIWRIGK